MLLVAPVHDQIRFGPDALPAVTHVDGSARIQTVRRIPAADTGQRLECRIEEIGIAAQFVQGQAAIAIGVAQRGVAACDVSASVDQVLRQPGPAGRLHLALGAEVHVVRRQPPVACIQRAGQFQQLMARVQAAMS